MAINLDFYRVILPSTIDFVLKTRHLTTLAPTSLFSNTQVLFAISDPNTSLIASYQCFASGLFSTSLTTFVVSVGPLHTLYSITSSGHLQGTCPLEEHLTSPFSLSSSLFSLSELISVLSIFELQFDISALPFITISEFDAYSLCIV